MKTRGLIGAVVTAVIMLVSCSSPPPATASLLLNQTLGEQTSRNTLSISVQYLDESIGSQYVQATLTGGSDAFASLYTILEEAVEQPAESVGSLSPESDCNYCIFLTNDSQNNIMTFYYLRKQNLLVLRQTALQDSSTVIQYRFFTPDAAIEDLLQAQRLLADEPKTDSNEAYLSPAQLKASIDSDELSAQGEEIAFEFYEDALPANLGPSCHIFRHGDFDLLPEGQALVVTRTTAVDGDPVNLSITGIEMNDFYIKVLVMKPDISLNEYEAATDYAALVSLSDLDLSRWFVFIDEEGNVLDVLVLKEDE